MNAYTLALITGLPDMVLWCDVQLTSDGAGICFPELTLNNGSDIGALFNESSNTYLVNGVSRTGWFSLDFTLDALVNVSCKSTAIIYLIIGLTCVWKKEYSCLRFYKLGSLELVGDFVLEILGPCCTVFMKSSKTLTKQMISPLRAC